MKVSSLYDALAAHAELTPDRVALQWLHDGEVAQQVTYAQLQRRAELLGEGLRRLTSFGDRVLLALDTSLDFLAAFLACQYAGRVAVPIAVPSTRESEARARAVHVRQHCAAACALISDGMRAGATDLPALSDDGAQRSLTLGELEALARASDRRDGRTPHDVAFLQYTSGSLAKPKGVIVGQANLLDNLRRIRDRFGHDADSVGLSWLPSHHDMGLVGGLLQPLFVGFRCLLMSPLAFVQRPVRWLEAITRFGATTTGGPCFGYDLCVRRVRPQDIERLELGSWSVAFVGAEKVRADVLSAFAERFAAAGFRAAAFTPCYGMAEATLMVSGQRRSAGASVVTLDRAALARGRAEPSAPGGSEDLTIESVSCGPIVEDHHALVIDPDSGRALGDGQVGELWLRGPSVAQGYFGDSDATAAGFGARVRGDGDGDGARYLRTGDQAFLLDGELHICGRYKTVLVIRGKKYASEDIEALLQSQHPALASHGGVAFDAGLHAEESLVVVHELERAYLRGDLDELRASMQHALGTRLGLRASDIALVLPGSLPRTTSGKLQRVACRELYRQGNLRRVAASVAATPPTAAVAAARSVE
jgi:acyl-CoA synthetase (AMP-forming)/AMP-acid ligase II